MHWASLFSKKFATLPSILSVDTRKEVKDARRASAALLYFLFFSSSTEQSTAAVFRCMCDGAPVSTTRLMLMSTIRAGSVPSLHDVILFHHWLLN